MPCAAVSSPQAAIVTPHSDLAGYLVERNYQTLGCDRWTARRVMMLCAKLGDTEEVLASRLRVRRSDFTRRMETDCWTKQDGLILTMLEREIDFLKAGIVPVGSLIPRP